MEAGLTLPPGVHAHIHVVREFRSEPGHAQTLHPPAAVLTATDVAQRFRPVTLKTALVCAKLKHQRLPRYVQS